MKTILKEIDYSAFEKALANKDAKYIFFLLRFVCFYCDRTLYLVQDPKTLKKERAKVDEKWKMITKQAQLKNPNFKEPTGICFCED